MRLKIRDTNTLNMDVETSPVEKGTLIEIKTDKKIAVVVDTGEGERIYLPNVSGGDSTYYAENTSGLAKTSKGYKVLHQESVEDINVLG